MHSVSQESSTVKPGQLTATLFDSTKVVKIPQFLAEAEYNRFVDDVFVVQDQFKPPGMEGAAYNGSLYLCSEPYLPEDTRADILNDITATLSKRILEVIPSLLDALDIPAFPIDRLELSILNGLSGHSADPHTDDCDGRNQLTVIYYFHKTPRAFSGGELELYATDRTRAEGHQETSETTIAQQDNMLVAFPSEQFHGVTPVQCDSDKFEDGRFVVVMFVGENNATSY